MLLTNSLLSSWLVFILLIPEAARCLHVWAGDLVLINHRVGAAVLIWNRRLCFLPAMDPLIVHFKITRVGKALLADGTLKWSLSSVYPLVYFKTTRPGKALLADGTLKWLLSGVCPLVYFKITRLGKALLADGTLKGPLSGVCPLMSFKISRRGKSTSHS